MKIGLALSGGGALGVAHIGVIEELENYDVKIDCICGVSSGAIIGLVYAAGGRDALNLFYGEVLNSNFSKKDKFIFSGGATAAFKFVTSLLKKITKGKDFNNLALPFVCCATNLLTGEMEIFREGDPVAGVMASSAYPVVFSAQKIGEKLYIDGGVTRNLPAEEARALGADFVVGSSIYGVNNLSAAKATKMNPLETALRVLNIYEKSLSRFEEKQCDFCFKPPVADYQWFDFFSMEEIVVQGRGNAAKQMGQLLPLLKKHE